MSKMLKLAVHRFHLKLETGFDHCAGVDVARQIETFRPREELVAPEIHKLAWN